MQHVRRAGEIGSEFWLESSFDLFLEHHVLSGRTAIDLILQDMMVTRRAVRTVLMPAWCCESMLQPFQDRGVNIRFYDISWDDGFISYHTDNTDEDFECQSSTDVLYVSNYFGYGNTLPVSIIEMFRQKGALVIYDRTHSLFIRSETEVPQWADYTFASIRKWIGVACGAIVRKCSGSLSLPEMKDAGFVAGKWKAMALKKAYMTEPKQTTKEAFLKAFDTFGHQLASDYRNYRMDEASLQIWHTCNKESIRCQRCENVQFVENALNRFSQLQPMFRLDGNDCPLFVPILFRNKEERDSMRKHLIANAVYCPIHWPKPNGIPSVFSANDIYDRELSLLCDQRYKPEDLQRMIDLIAAYYKNKSFI